MTPKPTATLAADDDGALAVCLTAPGGAVLALLRVFPGYRVDIGPQGVRVAALPQAPVMTGKAK